jgi:hypothetical protein
MVCGQRRDPKDMSLHQPRARLLRLATPRRWRYTRYGYGPQMLTSGATPDETTRTYPGDELLPDPNGGATIGQVLPAPPERVRPWLVQMGGDRGGWYRWDRLDNDGTPSRR